MKVLYIIGNGLDISMGMNTDYQSFYNYYKTIGTGDKDIEAMKKNIEAGRYETWADLEAGLGAYSKEISSESVYIKCLEHIKQSLQDYLRNEFEHWQLKKNHLVDDLKEPDKYLDSQVQNLYDRFVSTVSTSKSFENIRIVTLNYTEAIDSIVFGHMHKGLELLHLHGLIDDGMVMGVNDIQQITNDKFWISRDIEENFVKPVYNDACLNNNNALFEQWINDSHVIVLFGTSMGVTDRRWWRLIGERLENESSKVLVVFFAYDKDKDIQAHPNYRLRWTEEYQRDLLKKFEIPEDKSEQVLAKICIGINKPIFQ